VSPYPSKRGSFSAAAQAAGRHDSLSAARSPHSCKHDGHSKARHELRHPLTSLLLTAGPRNAVLLECGHGGLCVDCAKRLLLTDGRMCPICRQPITQVPRRPSPDTLRACTSQRDSSSMHALAIILLPCRAALFTVSSPPQSCSAHPVFSAASCTFSPSIPSHRHNLTLCSLVRCSWYNSASTPRNRPPSKAARLRRTAPCSCNVLSCP
jgi:hypothetical protein